MENTATSEQIEQATKMAANSKILSFERCLEIVLKNSVKQMSKKDIKKMNARNTEVTVTRHSDDIYAEAILNQRSSSQR